MRWSAYALLMFTIMTFSTAAFAQSKAEYQALLADPDNESLFLGFVAKLPSIVTEQDGIRRTYFILEGDLILTREQVRNAINFQARGSQPATKPTGELLVMSIGGAPVFWPRGQRQLTYAVNKGSFPSQQAYDTVVDHMRKASVDWQNVCPECGLAITHRPEFDSNPTLNQVLFIVSYVPNATAFIAAAFFPHEPIHRRTLQVGPQFFTTNFDRTGVLRHELGHVLGYRHEHIQGVSGCFLEDQNWRPLTPYDPRSVMHYFCGGAGTTVLTISESDQRGHRDLYR